MTSDTITKSIRRLATLGIVQRKQIKVMDDAGLCHKAWALYVK
jgi:predicted transcriptional regulator